MKKIKICKGCGEPMPYTERNGLRTYKQKHGYGLDCGCYTTWLISDEPMAKKVFDSFLTKNKKDYVKYKIAPRSKKRIAHDIVYNKLRKVFLNKPDNKVCPITGEPTTEIHHKWSGKDRDKYYLKVDTWLAVSRNGHIWIHKNPKLAREKGMLF